MLKFIAYICLLAPLIALAEPNQIHLRVNQLGYSPAAIKTAVLLAKSPVAGGFELRDEKGGKAFQGEIQELPKLGWGTFPFHAEMNFTRFKKPGRYTLHAGGTNSSPFEISSTLYAPLPDQLLEFMHQQRCGYNPYVDAACHTLDGRTAYGPATNGTYLSCSGGWHDAGDQLKYLITSGNATAQLLLAYELADANQRKQFADRVNALGQPGTNGIPDILDEAKWGLDWMLKLHPAPDHLYHQIADDRDHSGWRLPQNENVDYGWGAGKERVVYFADGKPQGLKEFKSESTGVANLAGRYAAAMGLAYHIWKEDPQMSGFARTCLRAGTEVYAMGVAKEGVQQGNSYKAPYRYEEGTFADDMEWGAAELYRVTKEAKYLADARRYAELAGTDSWMEHEQTKHYQYYPFLNIGHFRLYDLVDRDLKKVLAGYYQKGIQQCVDRGNKNPYRIGVPFIWCSNNLTAALATQCLLYQKMTGDDAFRDFTAKQSDWLLGRNPWGYSMFTEIGDNPATDVHLFPNKLLKKSVRGGLVDGPVYERIFKSLKGVGIKEPDPLVEFQDERAVYHNDFMDYSTNEPTMDGTVQAILMFTLLGAN